jgi:hypothetical protein
MNLRHIGMGIHTPSLGPVQLNCEATTKKKIVMSNEGKMTAIVEALHPVVHVIAHANLHNGRPTPLITLAATSTRSGSEQIQAQDFPSFLPSPS